MSIITKTSNHFSKMRISFCLYKSKTKKYIVIKLMFSLCPLSLNQSFFCIRTNREKNIWEKNQQKIKLLLKKVVDG